MFNGIKQILKEKNMNKNLIRIGILGALVVVCGLCALTTYGTVAWMRGNISNIDAWASGGESAQVVETRNFDVSPNLEITGDFSDIQVTAADVSAIEVELIKTAWAPTLEEAQAEAEAMTIRVTEGADTLTLVYDKPNEVGIGRVGADSLDFIVRVPAETSVTLVTSFGKIDVSGLMGDASLESEFGNLEVNNLTGALEASSNNASITIRQVEAGEGEISIKTSFGAITAEDLTGKDILITSNNGSITAERLTAQEAIQIENQFGRIEVAGVQAASLIVENNNGNIDIETGQVADLVSIHTEFGGIELVDVEASTYELSTSNGKLTVEGATGKLKLKNSFGDISITEASNVTLDVETTNGSITFTGSLTPTAHTIKNSFGNITLTIPEDSSFDVVLDTSFGKIASEIPLSLTGTLQDNNQNNHWEASMNGGGPAFNASTSNGNITIKILASGE